MRWLNIPPLGKIQIRLFPEPAQWVRTRADFMKYAECPIGID